MSRIGKLPVNIPDKVQVSIDGLIVKVKGPKGELKYSFKGGVSLSSSAAQVVVAPLTKEKNDLGMWGTTRTIIKNMVEGVSVGFTRKLQFTGVGYKAAVRGNVLVLNLGYSHPIEHELPDGISAKVNANVIELSGCDKELLGFVAAKIRGYRPPEPYKGKGVKYEDEVIIRKAGKTGGKK